MMIIENDYERMRTYMFILSQIVVAFHNDVLYMSSRFTMSPSTIGLEILNKSYCQTVMS